MDNPPKVTTNDITSILLNPVDILKLTHKETIIHPESKVLNNKEEKDYIKEWKDNGTLEIYEGKYPDSNYWFTTKIYRTSSKKVTRIEEIVRDGKDKDNRKKVIASITNFSGFELKDRTICEGHMGKSKIDPKYKRFMASEEIDKEFPQVFLNCNTISESMFQEFDRITRLNERYEKNGKEYWWKAISEEDHIQWVEGIMKSHSYQTQQRDNFISLKMNTKPGGKYAQIYWPKKLTHHRYTGYTKSSDLKVEHYQELKSQCADHHAFIAPLPIYQKDNKTGPKPMQRPSTPSSGTSEANVAQN